MKSNPADITCVGIPCKEEECCLHNQKCSSYDCHAGQSKRKTKGVCKDLKCTNKECCSDNSTCSNHNCESSYYTTKTLVPNPHQIVCDSPICSDAECCDIRPSGRLPKIKTWPLYNNSF